MSWGKANEGIMMDVHYLLDQMEKVDSNEDFEKQYNQLETIKLEYEFFDQEFEENGKVGLEDIEGRLLVPARFASFPERYDYFTKRGEPVVVGNEEGKLALVTTDGKGTLLTEFEYDYLSANCDILCHTFSGCLYHCGKQQGEKMLYGLLDRNGKEVVPCEMDMLWGTCGKVGEFVKDKKYGLYTTYGVYVEPVYDDISTDEDEYWFGIRGGVRGFFGEDGTFVPQDRTEELEDMVHLQCFDDGVD